VVFERGDLAGCAGLLLKILEQGVPVVLAIGDEQVEPPQACA
jgi:hypothetical protein